MAEPLIRPRAEPRTTGPKRGRAAVIGSGFGGLSAAIRLQHAGFDTVVFEARDKPGGRAYVYEDKGYTFDGGPTVITAPHVLRGAVLAHWPQAGGLREAGAGGAFLSADLVDGERFDYVGSTDAMLAEIKKRSPGDAEGYLRFVDYSKRAFDIGYTELVAEPFLRFSDMIKVAPDLIRLRADRSVYNTVARFVKDEQLRQALSFHSLLVGGNPFDTSAIYTLIHYLEKKWGVYFPSGGTGALVAALVKLFERAGRRAQAGARRCRTSALERENGRTVHVVSREGGQSERFDLVVSNADVHHTYSELFKGTPLGQPHRQEARAHGLVDEPVRAVLRHGSHVPRRGRAPHGAVRAALQGAAGRHLRRRLAARRLQPVPAHADGHRSQPRAARGRDLLRAVAGAAPRQGGHRLGEGGRDLLPSVSSPTSNSTCPTCASTW